MKLLFMQQPPKVWIISLLILIIIIFGICKYLQSQQNKGYREYFSNPLDYPHMNIYNYIDPKSGDFNTTKPDLKLDPSLLESRSVLSLQSVCDYNNNKIIEKNNPLNSKYVLQQQSNPTLTDKEISCMKDKNQPECGPIGDKGWLKMDLRGVSADRLKALLWVAYSRDDPQAFNSPKFINDNSLFTFHLIEENTTTYKPTIRELREFTDVNDNDEKTVWKLLECEIPTHNINHISWMIGPLSPEEKGYRYITGVRLFPYHRELEEYAYPVGLQGFIHSRHPKFKPSLTWLDLSHQARDFVWNPNYPEPGQSMKHHHLDLNTSSNFGWVENKPLTLVMKFNRKGKYYKSNIFEARKENGKKWLSIELTDDLDTQHGAIFSEDATHQYYGHFELPSKTSQTLIFMWNPADNIFKIRSPNGNFQKDIPKFYIKNNPVTPQGSKSIRINSLAGRSRGWDVELEYLFWYDRELDTSEIFENDTSKVGGGGRGGGGMFKSLVKEGFTGMSGGGGSVFSSSDKLVKAGGAKQLENGQEEEDADKDITDKEKCEPTSIVEANQDTAYVRYRSGLNAAGAPIGGWDAGENQTYSNKEFRDLLIREIANLHAERQLVSGHYDVLKKGTINPREKAFFETKKRDDLRKIKADIADREYRVVELTAAIEGKPITVGISKVDGTTQENVLVNYGLDYGFNRNNPNPKPVPEIEKNLINATIISVDKDSVPVKYNVRYQDGSTDTVTHNEIIRARAPPTTNNQTTVETFVSGGGSNLKRNNYVNNVKYTSQIDNSPLQARSLNPRPNPKGAAGIFDYMEDAFEIVSSPFVALGEGLGLDEILSVGEKVVVDKNQDPDYVKKDNLYNQAAPDTSVSDDKCPSGCALMENNKKICQSENGAKGLCVDGKCVAEPILVSNIVAGINTKSISILNCKPEWRRTRSIKQNSSPLNDDDLEVDPNSPLMDLQTVVQEIDLDSDELKDRGLPEYPKLILFDIKNQKRSQILEIKKIRRNDSTIGYESAVVIDFLKEGGEVFDHSFELGSFVLMVRKRTSDNTSDSSLVKKIVPAVSEWYLKNNKDEINRKRAAVEAAVNAYKGSRPAN